MTPPEKEPTQVSSTMSDDLISRLRKRAEIRRQIPTRKSVQEGEPDRIADLLEEAATALESAQRDLAEARREVERLRENFQTDGQWLWDEKFDAYFNRSILYVEGLRDIPSARWTPGDGAALTIYKAYKKRIRAFRAEAERKNAALEDIVLIAKPGSREKAIAEEAMRSEEQAR